MKIITMMLTMTCRWRVRTTSATMSRIEKSASSSSPARALERDTPSWDAAMRKAPYANITSTAAASSRLVVPVYLTTQWVNSPPDQAPITSAMPRRP